MNTINDCGGINPERIFIEKCKYNKNWSRKLFNKFIETDKCLKNLVRTDIGASIVLIKILYAIDTSQYCDNNMSINYVNKLINTIGDDNLIKRIDNIRTYIELIWSHGGKNYIHSRYAKFKDSFIIPVLIAIIATLYNNYKKGDELSKYNEQYFNDIVVIICKGMPTKKQLEQKQKRNFRFVFRFQYNVGTTL